MTLVSETLGRADDEVAFPMDLPSARARCRELLLGAFGLDDQGPLRRAVGRVQPGLAGNRPKLKDAGMESRPLIGSRASRRRWMAQLRVGGCPRPGGFRCAAAGRRRLVSALGPNLVQQVTW
jgi:hypothetical protein